MQDGVQKYVFIKRFGPMWKNPLSQKFPTKQNRYIFSSPKDNDPERDSLYKNALIVPYLSSVSILIFFSVFVLFCEDEKESIQGHVESRSCVCNPI